MEIDFYLQLAVKQFVKDTVELNLLGDINCSKRTGSTNVASATQQMLLLHILHNKFVRALINKSASSTGHTPVKVLAPEYDYLILHSTDIGYIINKQYSILLQLSIGKQNQSTTSISSSFILNSFPQMKTIPIYCKTIQLSNNLQENTDDNYNQI